MPRFKGADFGGVLQRLPDVVEAVVERVFAEAVHAEGVTRRPALDGLRFQIDFYRNRLRRLCRGQERFGVGSADLCGQDAVFEACLL